MVKSNDELFLEFESEEIEYFEFVDAIYGNTYDKLDLNSVRDYSTLESVERVLLFAMDLEGQIESGGFELYYFNPYGDNSAETLSALKLIGSTEKYKLLYESFGIFPSSIPSPDRAEREKQLELAGEVGCHKLRQLDKEYSQSAEDIRSYMCRYLIENKEGFV